MVIEICERRSHDELASRAEELLVDSGADQTAGTQSGSRSLSVDPIRDPERGSGQN